VPPKVSSDAKKVAGSLVAVALRPFVGDAADGIGKAISSGPKDDVQRLMLVMAESQDKGWRAMEVGLRGPSWWGKAGRMFGGQSGGAAIQKQIEAFLKELEKESENKDDGPVCDAKFKEKCLRELQGARKAGLIPGANIPAERFSEEIKVFPAGADTQKLKESEEEVLKYTGAQLAVNGYDNLASYISLAPSGDSPLLVLAVQFFFRRAVESDSGLAHMLQVQKLEQIDNRLATALDGLDEGFRSLGDKLDDAFGELSTQVSEVQSSVDSVHEKLDQIQLDEAKRQAAFDEERKQMMMMMQQMSQQIALLTGGTQQAPAPVDISDEAAVDKLREQAETALTEKAEHATEKEQAEIAALQEVTRRFDSVRKRAFAHLPSAATRQFKGMMPSTSGAADAVFGKFKNQRLKKKKRPTGPTKFTLKLLFSNEACGSIDVTVKTADGQVAGTYTTESDGTLNSGTLQKGSYVISVSRPIHAEREISLRDGTNVLADWDIACD